MSHPIDPRLLDRYLAGECSAAEEAEVARWMGADPRRGALVRAMRARRTDGPEHEGWDVDGAWRRVAARLPARPGEAPAPDTVVRPLRAPRRWSASPALRAAAVLLLAAGGVLTWQGARTVVGPRAPDETARADVATIATARGERRDVRLPDGTLVTLGVDSRLSYPRAFRRSARDVELAGEAYFRVVHDADRAFSVRAGGAVTRVLGTEFGVRAYARSEGVRVVVASGRVSLRPETAPTGAGAVLTPGQLGELGAGERAVRVRDGIDVRRYLAWTEGRLVLDDVPLRDALPQIARWYAVEIAVRDSALAARRINATFRDESLQQVLDAISLALGARYERAGRTVTFLPAAGR